MEQPRTPAPAEAEPEPHAGAHLAHTLMRFFLAVRYRKNVVLAAMAVAVLLGALYYLTATRYYGAKAAMLISQTGPDALNTSMTGEESQRRNIMPTCENIARSAKVLEQALEYLAPADRIDLENVPQERWIEALRENLRAINPFSEYTVHSVRITRRNAGRIFADAEILVEAFDEAAAKQMLIDVWLSLHPDRPIVAASGLAGYGKNRKLHTRRLGDLYVCGDEESQCPKGVSPMAPRVAIVANLQANLVVELLVNRKGRRTRA